MTGKPVRAVGILAGGGRLPAMLADSILARGGSVYIVGVIGEADNSIERFPHTWVNWAQFGKMLAALRNEGGGQVVIVGNVTRPDLTKLRPDLGFFRVLPRVIRMLGGGDDSVLTRVVKMFEHFGVTVRGAHEVAPDLLAGSGPIGALTLDDEAHQDAAIAFAVRRALAGLDAGQAVVVSGGRVLAIEGAEGTDAMLRRVAELPGRNSSLRAGVLAKGPKPRQELRVDMPAIGPRTVEVAVAAGLAAIVVESGVVLVLDREDAARAADAAHFAIFGLAPQPQAAVAASDAAPPPAGVCVGRVQPSARDRSDIARGLLAVARLAPFATGQSVAIAKAYILAIEADEGTSALLQRVGKLRQWGVGRRRKVGTLVRRIDGAHAGSGGPEPASLLREAAAQGLAGIAVWGLAADVAAFHGAAAIADELGLYLVVCERPAAGSGA